MPRPRLLLTNDDGIDSVGLHVLAKAMTAIGDVTVVAPDREYSGAGASIGALHTADPLAKKVEVDGMGGPGFEGVWTVEGPPALCVFFARMGAFGGVPDLIVSGINPGANVGRAVYHSGTVGACLTGRNGGVPGIAVSQDFAASDDDVFSPASGLSVEERKAAYEAVVGKQLWSSAATVAVAVVEGMLSELPRDPVGVFNLNVPNLPVDQMKGWCWTDVGRTPNRAVQRAKLQPAGSPDTYRVEMEWGEAVEQPASTDTRAMLDDVVSLTWLSPMLAEAIPSPHIETQVGKVLGH